MNRTNRSMNKSKLNKKANIAIAMMLAVIALVAVVVVAVKQGGIVNLFYEDVKSGTDVADGCKPKNYVVEFKGSLDLINQKQGTWTLDYDIDYIDAHIYDIHIDQEKLGFTSDTFDARICLYDVLAGGDNWQKKQISCVNIKDDVTYGHIEKFPFTFRYNLPDNDCNGQVDDHTFNLVTEFTTEDGDYEMHEKTVAIVDGKAVFQNVKY